MTGASIARMDQSPHVVTLGARDLSVSRAFSTDGLGWTPSLDLDEVVFYQVGKGLLPALFPLGHRWDVACNPGWSVTTDGPVITPIDPDPTNP